MNRTLGLLAGMILICGTALFFSFTRKIAQPIAKGNGFTLVELFTSEGCSSCPSADALVARINKENQGKPVYILAYQVDYWNRLGWNDPYSDAAYSKRQYQYASWLGLQGVYTPQIVVNGSTEFVGSEENKLRKAIAIAKTSQPFDIHLTKMLAGRAEVSIDVAETANSSVFIASVQKSVSTDVKRGENSGRTLPHINVVRSLQLIAPGDVSVILPKGYDSLDWDLIAFVQNTSTGEILAAKKLKTSISPSINESH